MSTYNQNVEIDQHSEIDNKELKDLIFKRGLLKAKLTRFINAINNSDSINSKELKFRLSKFEPVWDQYDDVQSQIEAIVTDSDQENDRVSFENQFAQTVAKAENIISNFENSSSVVAHGSSSVSSENNVKVKLPTLHLPSFSGEYEKWLFFADTFNSLINDNSSLSSIEKFHYLKSSLKGDACSVIESLSVTANNYDTAWQLLKNRYENKKLIIKNHIAAIINLPSAEKDSSQSLRQLLNSLNSNLRALKTLDVPVDSWDLIIIQLISSKFDYVTNKEWESSIINEELPTMSQMQMFLERRYQMLESISKPKNQSLNQSSKQSSRSVNHIQIKESVPNCIICKDAHYINDCAEFLKLTIQERFNECKKLKLCINCLKRNHSTSNCYSKYKCNICHKKHHKLLHLPVSESTVADDTSVTVPIEQPFASTTINNYCNKFTASTQVLLSTVLVHIYDSKGDIHPCRALLDVGSQSNVITKGLCDKLNLKCYKTNQTISGITEVMNTVTQSISIKIKSRVNNFTTNITCLVLPKITSNLPTFSFDHKGLVIPKHVQLSDPQFNISAPIDLLIGAELFWQTLENGKIKLGADGPILQKTYFGWVIGGNISRVGLNNTSVCNISMNALDKKLTKFWQIEEVEGKEVLSKHHHECEKHFQETHTRNEDGRYVVRLPFKTNLKPVGLSRQNAQARLFKLERKFKDSHNVRKEYVQFMDEYLKLNHMELVPDNYLTSNEINEGIYLPHHAVIKNSSTTTRVRVVFDGSAKTSNNVSLNDNLLVGPTIQHDLFSILLRFRSHKFVLTADISKMYRQVLIHPNDRKYQMILWRSDLNDDIKTYQLKTVTYGTTSAPFLAIRALHQVAIDERERFSLAHSIILRGFYVDDVLTGAESLEKLIKIRQELTEALSSAGFELCKFRSNNAEFLSFFNNSNQEEDIPLDKDNDCKTLGLLWNPSLDVFKYSVHINKPLKNITKRTILSVTSQIFDPLGLIGPVLIKAKLILQKLWALQLNWDKPVPADLADTWIQFTEELNDLNKIQISRKITCNGTPKHIDLHGFCDASELAYGAAIYARITDVHNNYTTTLLCAKSRVAPLNKITIPRLELNGALLLARLMNRVITSLNVTINKRYYWTDSSIVLAWITNSKNLKTYVANRVAEIHNLTNIIDWRHVYTNHNPADIISRGIQPSLLLENNLWFFGPKWLAQNEMAWPVSDINFINIHEADLERKEIHRVALNTLNYSDILSKYSNYTKTQRVMAYCLRFIYNCKSVNKKIKGSLTYSEINLANIKIIKLVQLKEFNEDIKHLEKYQSVSKSSKLLSLNPFLDKNGILRVGGRLRNAKITADQKNPIILAPNNHITELIINLEHIRQLHAGPQATLAAIRLRYWPLKGKTVVRKILHKCVICFRSKPKCVQQLMGDLPQHRVEVSRPFINCGVDYAGPILIKEGQGRGKKRIKSYIAVFICFATKAVHIELVCDLTSKTFLSAMKRFMSRRGKVSNIYSDNATTFVGANRELVSNFKNLFKSKHFQTEFVDQLAIENVNWHFIPPRSPHFGGLWEASVKSIKYHLKRILKDTCLTYDEMYTLLTQIESCLNSRPLTPLTDDPNDLTPLTPAHFLIGDSLTVPIEEDFSNVMSNRLKRWERVQQVTQHFWKRWSAEYLCTLQQRSKWKEKSNKNLKIGAIVVVKEDNLPPLQWRLGRIIQLHPGQDGVIRTVTIKTMNGVIKRSVVKISPLPINNSVEISESV